MLSGSQVFGWRAGAKAAKVATDQGNGRCSKTALERLTEAIARFSEVKGKKRPGELRPSLQQTMWEALLVEKDAESLSRARNFIADERERLASDVLIAETFDLALAFEHRNLLDVAEVIAEAASMRTESRGSHFRPRRNPRPIRWWM